MKATTLNEQQKAICARIGDLTGLCHANIDNFKNACVAGNAISADKFREEVLKYQGQMLDLIYARIVILKQMGVPLK